MEGSPSKEYNKPTCINCKKSQQFKGEKFTLQPPPPSVIDDIDRSVVGRALVVHSKVDNGGPPFGDVRSVLHALAIYLFSTLCIARVKDKKEYHYY